MFYYWDKYEKKICDYKDIANSGYSIRFLLKHGIVEKLSHEHCERHCILYKNGKYRVIKKKKGYDYKKFVRNLTYRGWQIVKYFDEKDLRNVEY